MKWGTVTQNGAWRGEPGSRRKEDLQCEGAARGSGAAVLLPPAESSQEMCKAQKHSFGCLPVPCWVVLPRQTVEAFWFFVCLFAFFWATDSPFCSSCGCCAGQAHSGGMKKNMISTHMEPPWNWWRWALGERCQFVFPDRSILPFVPLGGKKKTQNPYVLLLFFL